MTIVRKDSDIEPLSDVSWQRIERGIFAELDRQPVAAPERAAGRSWRSLWAVPALAAAAAAIWLVISPGSSDPGERHAQHSRIVTAESPTKVTLGRAAITVAPESAVLVGSGQEQEISVILEHGAVHCAVAPASKRPPFVVQAGDVRVEVVGTRFSVTREGASVRVAVERGTVWVFHDGDRTTVNAGEEWPTTAASKRDSAGSEAMLEEAGEAAESAERADIAESGASAAVARTEVPAPADKRREREDSEMVRNAGKQTGRQAEAASKPAPAASAEEAAKPAVQPASEPPSEQVQYEEAARLEAEAPAKALASYARLAKGTGPWAANALFAQARLELDLGHRERARTLLEQYVSRFPSGDNILDARELLGSLH